jgi:hypothetical protein
MAAPEAKTPALDQQPPEPAALAEPALTPLARPALADAGPADTRSAAEPAAAGHATVTTRPFRLFRTLCLFVSKSRGGAQAAAGSSTACAERDMPPLFMVWNNVYAAAAAAFIAALLPRRNTGKRDACLGG